MCYAIEIQKKGQFKVNGQGQILGFSYFLIHSLLAIGNLEQRLFQVQIKCQGHFLLKCG